MAVRYGAVAGRMFGSGGNDGAQRSDARSLGNQLHRLGPNNCVGISIGYLETQGPWSVWFEASNNLGSGADLSQWNGIASVGTAAEGSGFTSGTNFTQYLASSTDPPTPSYPQVGSLLGFPSYDFRKESALFVANAPIGTLSVDANTVYIIGNVRSIAANTDVGTSSFIGHLCDAVCGGTDEGYEGISFSNTSSTTNPTVFGFTGDDVSGNEYDVSLPAKLNYWDEWIWRFASGTQRMQTFNNGDSGEQSAPRRRKDLTGDWSIGGAYDAVINTNAASYGDVVLLKIQVSPWRINDRWMTAHRAAQAIKYATVLGKYIVQGAAAATLPAITEASTGTVVSGATGTATATLPPVTVAAAGKEVFTGTATATVPPVTVAASGTEIFTGTATATVPPVTEASVGKEVFTGTATATLPPVLGAQSGSVANPVSGTATATIPPITEASAGTEIFTGTATATLPPVTEASAGKEVFTGTVAATVPPIVGAETGVVANPVTGTVAATVPPVTVSASGTEIFTGTTTATIPPVTEAGAGTEVFTGTATATIPLVVGALVGAEVFTGTVSATVPPITGAETGVVANPVTGTATATLPPVLASSTGAEIFQGNLAATIPPVTESGAGLETISGSATATLPFEADSVGTEIITGTASATVPPLGVAGVAAEIFTGTVAAVLPPLTAAVIGDAGAIIATVTAFLPSLTGASAGSESFSGSLAASLPPIAVNASGTSAAPVTGTATASVFITVGAAGGEEFTGTASASIPPAQSAATGSEIIDGSVQTNLPGIVVSASGSELFFGDAVASFSFGVMAHGTAGFSQVHGGATSMLPGVKAIAIGPFPESKIIALITDGAIIALVTKASIQADSVSTTTIEPDFIPTATLTFVPDNSTSTITPVVTLGTITNG